MECHRAGETHKTSLHLACGVTALLRAMTCVLWEGESFLPSSWFAS